MSGQVSSFCPFPLMSGFDNRKYPFSLPVVRSLDEVEMHPAVTACAPVTEPNDDMTATASRPAESLIKFFGFTAFSLVDTTKGATSPVAQEVAP